VICGLLNCGIDLDWPSRSFQLFLSASKYSLLFRYLIESPGDLTKCDIADDLEWPLKVIPSTINGFTVSQTYSVYTNIMYKVSYSGLASDVWAVVVFNRIIYSSMIDYPERDPLAIAIFLVAKRSAWCCV